MKAKLMLCLCLLLAATTMFAQNLTVTGVVTEKATGYPAIGVSVLVKGTTNGTITSMDGDYTLSNVPKNATLVFSYVGMTTQEVPVNGQTVVNVLMNEDTQNLEEVVVIGYGTSKAKDLTAPIAVIKADEITKHATSSPMSALQGKVPGVQITNSGQPGSGPSVRIRGIGSMNTDSQPLYVVDGMFFDNIDFLNNSDIQDLSILKDASAASIYGVRAANGVVLVTTKKGALNRPATVTYDGYVGFQKATNVLKMANSEQYATMISEMGNETLQAVVNNAKNVWGTLPNTNWYDEILHTALTHNHSLDISGGTEKATYSVGTSYLYQDGILDSKNDYSRFNLRTKADYKAFDWLKVGANVVLSNSTQNLPNGEVWLAAFRTPGIIPVYDENSSLNPYPTKYGSPAQIGLSEYYYNPVAQAEYYDSKNSMLRVMPSFYAQFDFLPENKLFFKTAYSQDINVIQTRAYTPEFLVGGTQLNSTPLLNKKNDIYHSWILDNTLTYTDTFGDHGLTAMLGQSVREENWRNLWGEATGVPGGHEEYYYLNQGNADGRKTGDDGTTYRGVSWFGRVSYDYKGKYLLSATMRADGSSKFSKGNRWGYFPSAAVAWRISSEKFMEKTQNWLDDLKIRASYGTTGNDLNTSNKSIGYFQYIERYTTGSSYMFGKGLANGIQTGSMPTTDLTWATSATINGGIDFTLLSNRLSGTIDGFYRKETDILGSRTTTLPSTYGASLAPENYAERSWRGGEFTLTWRDKVQHGINYSLYMNIGYSKDRWDVLDESVIYMTGNLKDLSLVGMSAGRITGLKVDHLLTDQAEVDELIAKGFKQYGRDPYLGGLLFQDTRGDGYSLGPDGKIDGNDAYNLLSENGTPRINYGFGGSFSWKGITIDMHFQGVGSYDRLVGCDATKGIPQYGGNTRPYYPIWTSDKCWSPENPNGVYPRVIGKNQYESGYGNTDFWMRNGAYVRLKNLNIGYNLPASILRPLGLLHAQVFMNATNLFSISAMNEFMDPEQKYYDSFPLMRSFTFGLNFSF